MKTPKPIAGSLAVVAAGTEAAKAIDGKAANTLYKANQAAGIIIGTGSAIKQPSSLSPLNGINGPVALAEQDTPSATRQAMAAEKITERQRSAVETDIPLITSHIFIGDLAIRDIISLSIVQKLGEHNKLKLRFFQDQAQTEGSLIIDGAEKLLGQVAEVELYDRSRPGSKRLQNLFVIADVQFEQTSLNEGVLCLTGYAPTWILDGHPHFETFYKKDFNSIVKSVCKALPQVKAGLKAGSTLTHQLPFVCRYNESVWNFLKRLCAETGQWLYFNGTELVVGRPESRQAPKIGYGQNCYQINMSLHARPVQQSLFDYEAGDHRPISSEANKYNGDAGAYNEVAFKKSKELFGSTPAVAAPHFLPSGSDTLKTIAQGKGAQSAAGMYFIKGESSIYELRLGITAELDFKRQVHQSSHAPVRIISIAHHLDASGHYTNSFEAIPAAAEVPPVPVYQKPVTYPVLAEVIDNNDSKGRIRVKFLGWQQEGIAETDFIRVLTPDAGGGGDKVASNRGLVTIPEIGDQVYVDFEQGNPDRPFVTGSVFHGKHGVGGGPSNNIRSLTTRGDTAVILNEADNSAMLKDPSGNIVKLNGDGTITITAPNAVTINTKDFTVNAGNSITLNAQPGEQGGGEGVFDLTAKKTINITAQEKNITIKAINKSIVADAPNMNIELNAPNGKLDVQVKETSIIATTSSTFISTASTNIKGAPINLNQD